MLKKIDDTLRLRLESAEAGQSSVSLEVLIQQ